VAYSRGGAHTEEQHWSKWLTAEEVRTEKHWFKWLTAEEVRTKKHWFKWLTAEVLTQKSSIDLSGSPQRRCSHRGAALV
jgi:hypothetical protein